MRDVRVSANADSESAVLRNRFRRRERKSCLRVKCRGCHQAALQASVRGARWHAKRDDR